jgi:hypothetical protein
MTRGREAALKRAREKARLDKREAKREKKETRQAGESEGGEVDELQLWEQFARLNESHEANRITTKDFEVERQRIMAELGIGSDT